MDERLGGSNIIPCPLVVFNNREAIKVIIDRNVIGDILLFCCSSRNHLIVWNVSISRSGASFYVEKYVARTVPGCSYHQHGVEIESNITKWNGNVMFIRRWLITWVDWQSLIPFGCPRLGGSNIIPCPLDVFNNREAIKVIIDRNVIGDILLFCCSSRNRLIIRNVSFEVVGLHFILKSMLLMLPGCSYHQHGVEIESNITKWNGNVMFIRRWLITWVNWQSLIPFGCFTWFHNQSKVKFTNVTIINFIRLSPLKTSIVFMSTLKSTIKYFHMSRIIDKDHFTVYLLVFI